MDRTRSRGLQSIAFALVAGLILLRPPRLGEASPDTLAVGLVMIVLAIWEAVRGRASLLFRSVNKTDSPISFWIAVFFTTLLGISCVALSFA